MLDKNKNLSAILTASSCASDAKLAARELFEELNHSELGGVLFFCSADYDLPVLAHEIDRHFGHVPVAGCTTSGEITPNGYERGSVTAIAFNKNSFAISIGLITKLDEFELLQAQTLIDDLVARCREQAVARIKGHTFALTLLDGLSALEEQVLVTLNSVLGSIPSFGGSAADDEHLIYTHVYSDGQFYSDAAVLFLVNTACPFEVFSTHHMQALNEKLVVTKADADKRMVYELNAEPAAVAYSEATGVSIDDMDSTMFALNPIAVRIGEEYFVRAVQKVNSDLSLTFYCAIEQGIVLTTMQSRDILQDLEAQFHGLSDRIGEQQITIGCDCFLRQLEIDNLSCIDEASALLQKHNVIGFNTYGEQIGGMFINQTFTGVAIGVCQGEY